MGSKFERFLWIVAGAELDILEKCRTDRKKFSAIGATILMTAFIAFCAGTSAAWFFTQSGKDTSGSIGWSFLFGFIWALLIFCIDRSLVITLKKDPSNEKQKFLIPLLSRSLLAIIIAFMVSIPLELFIFKDFIAVKKINYDLANIEKLSTKIKEISGENQHNKDIAKAETNIKIYEDKNNSINREITNLEDSIQIERNKLNKPNTKAFNAAKKEYNEYNFKINKTQEKLKYASTFSDSSNYRNEIFRLTREREPYWKIMNDEKNAWNTSINERIEKLSQERDTKKEEHNTNTIKINNETEKHDSITNRSKKLATERDSIESEVKQIANEGNHFIRNYLILEYAVKERDENENLPTELFFLWMIRLLFFIIEILPTVVKIVTPIGSYDRMVKAEEKQMEAYLDSDEYTNCIRNMHDIELKSREEQLQKQHEIELELKNDILEKIKNAQMEIANATIQKWKESEISKIKTDSVETKSEEGE